MIDVLLMGFAYLDVGLYVLVVLLTGPCLLVYFVFRLTKWCLRRRS